MPKKIRDSDKYVCPTYGNLVVVNRGYEVFNL